MAQATRVPDGSISSTVPVSEPAIVSGGASSDAIPIGAEPIDEAVLIDGGSVSIRRVRPSDKGDLRAFFGHLSQDSSRYRFFSSRSEFPESETARMLQQDPSREVCLVATVREDDWEHIVGVAELVAPAGAPTSETEGPRRMEFAVAVSDEHQGRGIGTLLLERLVRAAREMNITDVDADVLGDNWKMLDMFAKSGFELTKHTDSGVVHLSLPTDETEKVVVASLERERLAARASIHTFFEPSSVAVVGASRRNDSIGGAVVANLRRAGFRGDVYPVNPNAEEIAGLRCFPSLAAIGKAVDLVVVAVPAAHVEKVVFEAGHVHAKGVVVLSSGFAEASPEGRAAEARLRRLVRGNGMRLVGPNCMGVLNRNPETCLNATFAPNWPPPGNVSMLTQSGALGIAMLDYANKLNIGISKFVSVGNKADVSSNNLLAYWGDDASTRVIVLYLESFGNARKFARLVPEIARRKPIVAVKSGRSAAGTRAASSHSASLASLDVGIDALFASAGVIRTNTLEEMFDVVALLSTQPVPRGPRVGVVTNAGGPGILLADACEAHGLKLPTLSDDTLRSLREFLPHHAGFSNPVDMTASATPEQYERTLALVANDPNVDSVVVIYIPPLVTKPEEIASAIARGAANVPAEKPIATVFLSSEGAPAALSGGPRGKIPAYSFPENAALALSAAYGHARFQKRPRGTIAAIPVDARRRIRSIVARTLQTASGEHTWVSVTDLATILGLAGIVFAPIITTAPDPKAAASASTRLGGYPVVLKAVSKTLIHKSDVGGVALGLTSSEAVSTAAKAMRQRLDQSGHVLDGFLVQRQIDEGIEALVGVTSDPALGPILVAGLGGVQVELLGDVAFRLPPVSDVDAHEMLDGIRASKLFDGYRGSPRVDREALIDIIMKVSALVEIVPELTELDLNPVKVRAAGTSAIVVDGRMRVHRRGGNIGNAEG